MQVTTKNLSDTKVKLMLTADAELLAKVKEATLRELAKEMRLPGFRQGKAPLALVEKNANPQAFQAEFLDRAMNALYAGAISQEKLNPVARPEVKISKFVPFDTLEMEAEVEVVGKVTLIDYKKIKMAKKTIKITENEIDEVIERMQVRQAEKKDVERAAKETDQVWIDFKGVDAKTKEPIQGADGEDYPLVIGSKTFIPGFEENMLGLKAGDEKTFDVVFPADYGVKSLQKKKVAFTVTVKKVQEVVKPKVDDKFAAEAGPFKTVAELRDDVKKQLSSEKEYEATREFTDELLMKVAKDSKVAIPETLITEQIDRLVAEQKQSLVYRGQTWQEFLDAQGKTEEEYRGSLREDAELRVKAGIVLAEISEAEKLVVEEAEFNARIETLRKQYPDTKMQEELDRPEVRREIAAQLLTEKTVEKLVEHASKK